MLGAAVTKLGDWLYEVTLALRELNLNSPLVAVRVEFGFEVSVLGAYLCS